MCRSLGILFCAIFAHPRHSTALSVVCYLSLFVDIFWSATLATSPRTMDDHDFTSTPHNRHELNNQHVFSSLNRANQNQSENRSTTTAVSFHAKNDPISEIMETQRTRSTIYLSLSIRVRREGGIRGPPSYEEALSLNQGSVPNQSDSRARTSTQSPFSIPMHVACFLEKNARITLDSHSTKNKAVIIGLGIGQFPVYELIKNKIDSTRRWLLARGCSVEQWAKLEKCRQSTKCILSIFKLHHHTVFRLLEKGMAAWVEERCLD